MTVIGGWPTGLPSPGHAFGGITSSQLDDVHYWLLDSSIVLRLPDRSTQYGAYYSAIFNMISIYITAIQLG